MTTYLDTDAIADAMVTEAFAARTAHRGGDPVTATQAARRCSTLAWQLTVELEQDITKCGTCKRDLPEYRVTGRRDGQPLCNDCKYDGGPPAEPAQPGTQCHTCRGLLPHDVVHWNGDFYQCERCSSDATAAATSEPAKDPWDPEWQLAATVPVWPAADEPH